MEDCGTALKGAIPPLLPSHVPSSWQTRGEEVHPQTAHFYIKELPEDVPRCVRGDNSETQSRVFRGSPLAFPAESSGAPKLIFKARWGRGENALALLPGQVQSTLLFGHCHKPMAQHDRVETQLCACPVPLHSPESRMFPNDKKPRNTVLQRDSISI